MNGVMVNEERGVAVRTSQTEMMISRQAQEVQAAMVIAKRFPRDEVDSFNRILTSCQRKSLAETATYEYPRGGTKVTGPSIRLAEAIAQNWGNIDFGITELEQSNGESQVMAYAWDLETNARQTKIFTVPHIRGTKKGNVPLTDPRDIYEIMSHRIFPAIKALKYGHLPDFTEQGELIEIPDESGKEEQANTAFAKYMEDAMFLIPTPQVLQKIITGLDDLYEHDIADLDMQGDLYEYMLGKLATAG